MESLESSLSVQSKAKDLGTLRSGVVSVLVPVYNEQDSIEILYRELKAALSTSGLKYEICFIDDGSTDQTVEKIRRLPGVHLISFTRNFGKSQALQVGFNWAQGDIIVTLDGDLQDDPAEIPKFIEAIENGADLVSGWKFRRLDPLTKRVASKIANTVNRSMVGLTIHDMNCGFKAYRKAVVKNLRLSGDMHRYIPSIASGFGYRVVEVKINHRERRFGYSKYGFKRLFSGLFDFFSLILMRRFSDRPMHFFGLIGLIMGGVGSGVLFYLAWIRLFEMQLIGHRPILIFGVLLVILGFQFISLGFVGDLILRAVGDGSPRYVIRWQGETEAHELTS